MDKVAFDAIFPALQQKWGNNLAGAYLYAGSGGGYFVPGLPESNLLLIVHDSASLHDSRDTFLSIWEPYAAKMRHSPLVTTYAAIRRHLQLNPLFAYHLYARGKRLLGETLFKERVDQPHSVERTAYLCGEAAEASVALAPQLLSPDAAAVAHERLYHLATYLSGKLPDDDTPVNQLFALVQVHLCQRIDAIPFKNWPQSGLVQSEEVPNLQAMVEDREYLTAVIPPLANHLLQHIDWLSLTNRLPDHLNKLAVATTRQLMLIIQTERSLDFVLGNFKHVWGANFLAGMKVSAYAVFRQAARNPSRLLVTGLLSDYLLAPDDEAVHKVIHDYQNRLLNMRLEHELLHRLFDIDRAEPPEPLPRRDEPLTVRIDAIYEHLNWWTGYYAEKMAACSAEQKMSAV